MSEIKHEIEKQLEELLGAKRDNKFYLEDKITVEVEEQNGAPYLWVVDDSRANSFAWLFNIEKVNDGYKFFFDKYEYIECKTLPEVFDVVRENKFLR